VCRCALYLSCHFLNTVDLLPSSLFFTASAPPEIYALSLHDALPISASRCAALSAQGRLGAALPQWPLRTRTVCKARVLQRDAARSEEHTSELQSPYDLVCRLLLEKKKHLRFIHFSLVYYKFSTTTA